MEIASGSTEEEKGHGEVGVASINKEDKEEQDTDTMEQREEQKLLKYVVTLCCSFDIWYKQ